MQLRFYKRHLRSNLFSQVQTQAHTTWVNSPAEAAWTIYKWIPLQSDTGIYLIWDTLSVQKPVTGISF